MIGISVIKFRFSRLSSRPELPLSDFRAGKPLILSFLDAKQQLYIVRAVMGKCLQRVLLANIGKY